MDFINDKQKSACLQNIFDKTNKIWFPDRTEAKRKKGSQVQVINPYKNIKFLYMTWDYVLRKLFELSCDGSFKHTWWKDFWIC